MELFQDFIASPAGLAAKAMLGLAFLDFLLGATAALRDATFDTTVLAAFVRKQILGRVLPITTLLAGGFFLNDATILGGGIAAAGIYTVETAASLLQSIGQVVSPSSDPAPLAGLDGDNPVPSE